MCRELMFEQLIIISHQLRIPFKNPDKSIYVRINIKIAFFSFLTNIEIVSFKKKKKKRNSFLLKFMARSQKSFYQRPNYSEWTLSCLKKFLFLEFLKLARSTVIIHLITLTQLLRMTLDTNKRWSVLRLAMYI